MKILFVLFFFPVLIVQSQSRLDKKIAAGVLQVSCEQPNEKNPVTINAMIVREADSIAVIVKARLAYGWHIYQYVPSTLPYIAMEQILKLPENIRAVGHWKNTDPQTSSNDPGVLIYTDEAIFIHKAVVLSEDKSADKIKAGLYYQTCDLRQCLPPVEKTIALSY